MNHLLFAGFALTFSSLIGYLSLELIGTAHAARDAENAYLIAVSSGPALYLVRHGTSVGGNASARQMTCGRLVTVGELQLGLHCRNGGISGR